MKQMVATEQIKKLEDLEPVSDEHIEKVVHSVNNFLQGGLYFETGSAFTIYASIYRWASILHGINDLLTAQELITDRFENYDAFKTWFDALPLANKQQLAVLFAGTISALSIMTSEIKLYVANVDILEKITNIDLENNNLYYIDNSTGTLTDVNTLITGTTRLLFNDSEISTITETD